MSGSGSDASVERAKTIWKNVSKAKKEREKESMNSVSGDATLYQLL